MSTIISEDHIKDSCKLGTAECCAYLVMSPKGWRCAKDTAMRFQIELRLAEGSINATGDNCEGWERDEIQKPI
jgi:hypothetical protein